MDLFTFELKLDLARLDALDRAKTGRLRCIGCGRFVKFTRRWNQCADCDTR